MFYTISLAALMLCTSFEMPLVLSDAKFRSPCKTEYCRGEALVACLETLTNIEYGQFTYVCVWRR
jgi:hypothetical protein